MREPEKQPPASELPNDKLEARINNYRRHGATHRPQYREDVEELARRKGCGLTIEKSVELIRTAAKEGRYLSYKELSDQSGADWGVIRFLVNDHLWHLVRYADSLRWPMLSAVVVKQTDTKTGIMKGGTLKGFVDTARLLGYDVADEEAFLREQRRLVFEWAGGSPPTQEDDAHKPV